MYIKSFGINIDKSKRLWGIILTAILVAITLITISFILVFKKNSYNSINKISDLYDLFNAKSYYAEYDLKIVSNKNENVYKIKEWYVNENEAYKFRIETDNDENNFVYCGDQNNLYIKSEEQLNLLNLHAYNSKKSNVITISSIMDFFGKINLLIDSNNYSQYSCCKIKEIEENEKIAFEVNLNNEIEKNSKCEMCKNFLQSEMKISKIKIVLDKVNLTPLQYTLYNTEGKVYMDILYNKFLVNKKFDEKLFAF